MSNSQIVLFLIVCTGIILVLALVTVYLIYKYQKRRYIHEQELIRLKQDYEKTLLKTQVEIQEQTFFNISREIHDNVNLSLTLAKLHLNTINWKDVIVAESSVKESVGIISSAISDLSDMSRSMNSELIKNLGLIRAIENEIRRLEQFAQLTVHFEIKGEPVFIKCDKELFIFRIVQEAFNNIIKHACTNAAWLHLHYDRYDLEITVRDKGVGFHSDIAFAEKNGKAGLKNIKTRAQLFDGRMLVNSLPNKGTELLVTVPI